MLSLEVSDVPPPPTQPFYSSDPRSNDWYRALTELVQNSAYRGAFVGEMSLVVIQYIQYGLAIPIARLSQWEGKGSFTCSNCFYLSSQRLQTGGGGGRQQPLYNICSMTISTLVSCSVYIYKPPTHPEDPIENNIYFLLPTHKIIDLKCKYYKHIQGEFFKRAKKVRKLSKTRFLKFFAFL